MMLMIEAARLILLLVLIRTHGREIVDVGQDGYCFLEFKENDGRTVWRKVWHDDVERLSENEFYAGPWINVTHPVAAITLRSGDRYKVRWHTTRLTPGSWVAIKLYHRQVYVKTITVSTPDDDEYTWIVDVAQFYSVDTPFHVRVYSTHFSHIYGTSPTFRISHPH